MTRPPASGFRQRLLANEPLLGTFIKTPTSHAIEILADVGFDFVIVDAEHAPFDAHALDVAMLAARAADIAALVRVAGSGPETVLSALDCGAAGVVVPHVASPAAAAAIPTRRAPAAMAGLPCGTTSRPPMRRRPSSP